MRMNNTEIRKLIEKKRLRYYEVARAAGVNPQTFSGWLQTELTDERKKRVLKAIESLQV